jgi:hypothetical protein
MRQMIPYGILAVVTALIAWCMVHLASDVVEATNNIWPKDSSRLPQGLELIQRYGMLLFLIPITSIILMFVGRRFQIINSPVVIAIFAAVAMVLLVFAGLMFMTPVICHGSYL